MTRRVKRSPNAGVTGRQAGNTMKRSTYTDLYGPTTEDRVRLADSGLTLEVEADWSGGPKHAGDEMVFGGGKVIRESMGMAHVVRGEDPPRAFGPRPQREEEPAPADTVVTGALILDWWGVVKADVGIRNGQIHAIGKAYNPETMNPIPATEFEAPYRDSVLDEPLPPSVWTPANFVVGPSTEVISGNGRILTAGGVDTHVHFVCPGEIHEALAAGMTTLVGGGTGPAEGSTATTVTPGAWHLTRMFEDLDELPVNIGLLAKGSTVNQDALEEEIDAGAIGFKVHEDWGAGSAVIDAALTMCEKRKVQLSLHADSLNESGFLDSTRNAFTDGSGKKRSIHIFHVEGAGGGHAPDMIELVMEPNVLPASTNPTRPLTVNTVAEHLDMVMVCHHLNPKIPADLAFADSRVRPSTMAAEDLLHDRGAISMMSSDAQAMGRIGEVATRTWQTAHVMKDRYGPLPEDLVYAHVEPDTPQHSNNPELKTPNDNFRARRYIAKYTINPSLTQGIDDYVGSVEVGKLADLVLWEPKFFGVKPHLVIKGGQIAYAQVGDANASIPTPQPYMSRPVWGGSGRAARSVAFNFVAPDVPADEESGQEGHSVAGKLNAAGTGLRLDKTFVPIKDPRAVTKKHMKLNGLYKCTESGCDHDRERDPRHKFDLKVDHNSFEVTIGGATTGDSRTEIDGQTVPRSYVTELPMAQRYFLFGTGPARPTVPRPRRDRALPTAPRRPSPTPRKAAARP